MVGMVLAGAAPRVGVEPFFMELVTGMEEVLQPTGRAALLLVVADLAAEITTYRRWAADATVEAVVVVNLTEGDTRPAVLAELGLPALLAGRHSGSPRLSSVVTDDAGAITAGVELLASLGHARLARVTGPGDLVHTRERTAAMTSAAQRLGLEVSLVESDYTAEGGVAAVHRLLEAPHPPTGIIFDNDVMAVAALDDLTRRGVHVPDQVSILACDDSALCELAVPPLSALSIDSHDHGVRLGEAVLRVLAGRRARVYAGPPIRVQQRASTGPAPAQAVPVLA